MSKIIAEWRRNMFKKFIPIPCELFPRQREIIHGTNCLAFALGIYKPTRNSKDYELKSGIPIEIAFLQKVRKLGFDEKAFRKIDKEEEKNTKGYIIRVYEFAEVELIDGSKEKDFHLIRREPNGKWVHKPGFGCYPRMVSLGDWMTLLSIYGDRFVSFAINI